MLRFSWRVRWQRFRPSNGLWHRKRHGRIDNVLRLRRPVVNNVRVGVLVDRWVLVRRGGIGDLSEQSVSSALETTDP